VKNIGQRADLGKKSCTNTLVQYEIIQYERTFAPQVQMCHGTKPMHPSSSRAFQRHQEHDLKHPSSVDLITTKQNKLPSFIDRWANMMLGCASGCYFWAHFSFGTFVIKKIRISGLGISN
jgi:hypothetical protein